MSKPFLHLLTGSPPTPRHCFSQRASSGSGDPDSTFFLCLRPLEHCPCQEPAHFPDSGKGQAEQPSALFCAYCCPVLSFRRVQAALGGLRCTTIFSGSTPRQKGAGVHKGCSMCFLTRWMHRAMLLVIQHRWLGIPELHALWRPLSQPLYPNSALARLFSALKISLPASKALWKVASHQFSDSGVQFFCQQGFALLLQGSTYSG